MLRLALALFLLSLLPGCGPLVIPAVLPLDADAQEQVDRSWNNMLAPPARLDRELLLDTILAFQLHNLGVDRLHMQSQKRFDGGTVTMDVYFDRARPDVNAFWVSVHDLRGRLARVQRYPAKELFERAEHFRIASSGMRDVPATQPTSDEQQAAQERRFARIIAATQPAERPLRP